MSVDNMLSRGNGISQCPLILCPLISNKYIYLFQVAKAANLIVTITLQTQIQVRKFVMALTSVENEVFLTVSSDVQKRLSLIQQDLAACA